MTVQSQGGDRTVLPVRAAIGGKSSLQYYLEGHKDFDQTVNTWPLQVKVKVKSKGLNCSAKE